MPEPHPDPSIQDSPRHRFQFRWGGDWIALSVVLALWVATLVPLLPAAAANSRMVEAFNIDEAIQLNLLLSALRSHSWALRFGAYGHLHFNLALALLKTIWPVSEQAVVMTMRGLSLAAATALLVCTFAWTRRTHGTIAAWVAFALVALNPMVYQWASVVHPDMLQAVLLLLALWATARAFDHPTTGRIAGAAALAGLAFATKYSGIFVLPFIVAAVVGRSAVKSGPRAGMRILFMRGVTAVSGLAIAGAGFAIDVNWVLLHITSDGRVDVPLPLSLEGLIWIVRGTGLALLLMAAVPWLWTMLKRRPVAETVAWGWMISASTFAACFVLFSPYSFVKLAFIKGLYYEAVETGAVLNLRWTETWTRGVLAAVGAPVIVALLATLPCRLADRRRPTSGDVVLFVWIALYMLVLLAPVHELLVHYALPLLAPAGVLAGRGIASGADLLAFRYPRVPRWATAGVLLVAMAGLKVPTLAALTKVRQDALAKEQARRVVAGNWLLSRVPLGSRIVYEYYSYVPPAFRNTVATWGDTREWLLAIDPDVVVVSRFTFEVWHGLHTGESYSRCLHDGSCGYVRTLESGPVEVFEKAGSGTNQHVD